MVRVLIAGLAGGVIVFFVGALAHVVGELESRQLHSVTDEPALVETLNAQKLAPGMYHFPGFEEHAQLTPTARASMREQLNERYKAGPSGVLVIAPTGEDMMGGYQLGGEFVCDLFATTLAAWIVSQFRRDAGYFRRWLALVMLAPVSWFSLSASYHLWYRFSADFAVDGLLCAIIEWSVAALAMAALLRPRPEATSP